MKQLLSCVFLLLAALGTASAAAGPAIKADTMKATLTAMLTDYQRYAETVWHNDTAHPGEGYWGSGRADGGNEGARATSTTAIVYALLYNEGDHRIAIKDRVDPALRYACANHLTGAEKGTDNRQWGNSWQSAMYAGNLGVAAWLARKDLSPETMAAVKRVVAYEADRFIGQAPPSMLPGDTKAEENAWDLMASSAAVLLMPDNPHAAEWNQTVLRYGFNTLSDESDKNLTAVMDGKPLSQWITTTQVFPDYTLENHGIFHPVYSMIGPATNAEAGIMYLQAGKKVPDALTFNVMKGWHLLQYIALPDGEWLYPQGLDWAFHDYEHIHYYTFLATKFKDPSAALLEERLLGYARKRQMLNGDGRFVGEHSDIGFAREAVAAERIAYALMMHELYGPPPAVTDSAWTDMVKTLKPARELPYVGVALLRGPRGVFSISWMNRLLGMAVPNAEDYLNQPYITTPFSQTLVGHVTVQGQPGGDSNKFTVTKHVCQIDKSQFAATIDSEVNNGDLRQQIAAVALQPGIMAYIDRVTAIKPVTVTEARGLAFGIENDEVSGNLVTVHSADGDLKVTGGEGKDHPISGNWINIDDHFGLISALSPSIVYRAASDFNRPGAREDYLFGTYSDSAKPYAAGDTVAERAGLVILNSSADETSRLAKSVSATSTGGVITLKFTDLNGKPQTLTLNTDGSGEWGGKGIK